MISTYISYYVLYPYIAHLFVSGYSTIGRQHTNQSGMSVLFFHYIFYLRLRAGVFFYDIVRNENLKIIFEPAKRKVN
jgi:hypothetical protein